MCGGRELTIAAIHRLARSGINSNPNTTLIPVLKCDPSNPDPDPDPDLTLTLTLTLTINVTLTTLLTLILTAIVIPVRTLTLTISLSQASFLLECGSSEYLLRGTLSNNPCLTPNIDPNSTLHYLHLDKPQTASIEDLTLHHVYRCPP